MRGAGMAVVMVCVGACTCPEPYAVWSADFEYCGGTCAWSVAGEGSVSLVATVHPGEHGLRLDARVTATAPAAVGTGQYYNDGLWLEMVTTCEGAPSAQLVAVGIDQYALALTLTPGPAIEPQSRDYHPMILSLPPRPASQYDPNCNPNLQECCDPTVDWNCYNDLYDGSAAYAITSVSVTNRSGVCVIDQLRIMQPTECY